MGVLKLILQCERRRRTASVLALCRRHIGHIDLPPAYAVGNAGPTTNWREKWKPGRFLRKLPDGVKPTHIIVGAGSAGCVLANRLTENADNRVLLVEAGPQDHWHDWRIHMPAALMYNLRNNRLNWMYFTTAQAQMNERVLYWPRGRVWGGSSSLNAMVYVRGHPFDYDRWEREGAKGWAFRHCLPYFKKAQTHQKSTGADDQFRGHTGPLYVTQGACENPLHQAFMASGEQHGLGLTDDMNGARQEGLGKMDMTIRDGKRWSASAAYLHNVGSSGRREAEQILDRPNLFTTAGIMCTSVLFNGSRAIGIEYIGQMNFGSTVNVDAYSREKIYCEEAVILAAGAINTPQLLMVSGVGPARHLFAHQIPVVQDMPGVGQNLQDHLEVYVQQKCTKPITLYNKSTWRHPHNMVRVGLQWFLTRKGLAASSHLESGGFARSSAQVEHPDLQFHFLPSTVHEDGRADARCHGYQVHVGPMRSRSTGSVTLQTKDPRNAPVCEPNYLAHEQDLVEFRAAVRLSRELFAQRAFDEFRGEEMAPSRECQSDQQIDDFVRTHAASAYHPSCTCRMGPAEDDMAVVDPETMNVHGFENLKVVDASVMPSIVSGNLNAPVIMVAEKAADIIAGKAPLAPEQPPIWAQKRA